jgi:signal transduction histidine kinase
LGGFFLASRALQPIDRITQTAQAISASDLDRRIHYKGPADEVGRLAQTFDTMLNRLQTAFVRERRFTSDAAHELRTPLAALKGRIGVTLSRPRQPAVYRETLQEMEQQVDRLIRLSNDLLFMTQLEQAQIRPQQERIMMADLVGAVVDQVRPLAEAKSITLEQNIYSGLMLQGDLDLLIRLHLNLLDNAIKYTPTGGRVMVQAKQDGSQAIISIRDTGPGIPAEHVPQLFERFYRVESDRARWRRDNGHENGENGAGLGLSIAYEIARTHGGNLTVQSDVGRGTTFFVQLPTLS